MLQSIPSRGPNGSARAAVAAVILEGCRTAGRLQGRRLACLFAFAHENTSCIGLLLCIIYPLEATTILFFPLSIILYTTPDTPYGIQRSRDRSTTYVTVLLCSLQYRLVRTCLFDPSFPGLQLHFPLASATPLQGSHHHRSTNQLSLPCWAGRASASISGLPQTPPAMTALSLIAKNRTCDLDRWQCRCADRSEVHR